MRKRGRKKERKKEREKKNRGVEGTNRHRFRREVCLMSDSRGVLIKSQDFNLWQGQKRHGNVAILVGKVSFIYTHDN